MPVQGLSAVLRRISILTIGLILLGCGGDSNPQPNPMGPGAAARIAGVSGDGQSALVGTALPDPLIVRVTDDAGASVSGVTVTWSVTAGGGSVDQATTTTGADGRAQVILTVGGGAGANTVTASAAGLDGSPVTFGATAILPLPAAAVDIGDNFFDPTAVNLAVGGTVTWTWVGGNPHNVTFDSGGANSTTETSGTFDATFNTAGTFTYICTVHGRAVMEGTITVVN